MKGRIFFGGRLIPRIPNHTSNDTFFSHQVHCDLWDEIWIQLNPAFLFSPIQE